MSDVLWTTRPVQDSASNVNKQADGRVPSNQRAPFQSHARGGQTQAGSFAHAGKTLRSSFWEIVRHHAAILPSEPQRSSYSSSITARRRPPTSHHPTEAGAQHGGVNELLQTEETKSLTL